jgi:hypothetical protein
MQTTSAFVKKIIIHSVKVLIVVTWLLRYLILFLKEHGSETYADVCTSYVDTMKKVDSYDSLFSFSMSTSMSDISHMGHMLMFAHSTVEVRLKMSGVILWALLLWNN